MIDVKRFKTIYVGSVKNLRVKFRPTKSRPGVYLFEFTDNFSIFDYGKMPDAIPGKGAATAVCSAYFFERAASAQAWRDFAASSLWKAVKSPELRDELLGGKALKRLMQKGMPTHYRGILAPDGRAVCLDRLKAPSNVLEVNAANIVHPKDMFYGGRRIWNYNHVHDGLTNYLVPLECVFRFGMPEGSSLVKRLHTMPDYHHELGLKQVPKPGAMLPRPVLEFFSKLEPADRLLSHELALNVCGLRNEDFLTVAHYTLLLALFMHREFAKAKVVLWDGKFEFVNLGGIALGDAITPDELRLTLRDVQLSKEPVRQYYRKYEPAFVAAMDQAKKIATKVDKPLARIVNDDLRRPPPPMNGEFLAAVSDMYVGLTEAVCGTGLFGKTPSLARVMKTYQKFGIA
jgi:phosphoribosylaminoimidazole-succinocarboxamide synthase